MHFEDCKNDTTPFNHEEKLIHKKIAFKCHPFFKLTRVCYYEACQKSRAAILPSIHPSIHHSGVYYKEFEDKRHVKVSILFIIVFGDYKEIFAMVHSIEEKAKGRNKGRGREIGNTSCNSQ